MKPLTFLRANLDAFLESAKRFPLTLAFGSGGAIAGAIMALTRREPEDSRLLFVLLACWLSVPVSFALTLLAEALRFERRGRLACAAASLVLAGLAYAGFALAPERNLPLLFALWSAAALAAVAVTPLFARHDTARFRHFNLVLLQRLLATIALAVPLFLGLLLAVWALRTLFTLRIYDGFEASLWFLVTGVFGTAYFAGNAPRLDARDVAEHPAFLRALTRFILLPLSLTYLLILYAYVLRIVILREWPQGMVSALILAFAATGIATHLLLQDNPAGGRVGTWYGRRFYLVLAPLVVMLFGAIWRRHSEYGLTEERALVWVAAFWLAGISAYFLLRRSGRLEAIPLTLGLVALGVSIGPWSLFEVSIDSQVARLESNLAKAARLDAGRLTRSTAAVSDTTQQEIAQILIYLRDREALDRLRPWFAPAGTECASCLILKDSVPAPETLVVALGLEWMPYARAAWKNGEGEERYFNSVAGATDVRGYDVSLPVSLNSLHGMAGDLESTLSDAQGTVYRISLKRENRLTLSRRDDTLTSFELTPWVLKLEADSSETGRPLPVGTLRLDWKDAEGRYSLRLSHLRTAARDTRRPKVEAMEGVLLLAPAR